MQPASSRLAFANPLRIEARRASKGLLTFTMAMALAPCTAFVTSLVARAGPSVEFDIARAVECRDITPRERLVQYPTQRLIEVALPVSVRFNDVPRDDVDEIDIEVSGASAGLRVQDFAPATKLASEITREIETTTTTKKTRSLEGTLGGTLPIPGAEAAAHITPSRPSRAACPAAKRRLKKSIVCRPSTWSS
jgi:hypothetical protein